MRRRWGAVRISFPRIRPLWLLSQAYWKFVRDDALTLSAAIAYSALLSVFPLLLGVVALVGLIADQNEVRRAMMQTLLTFLPRDTAEFVDRSIGEVVRARGTIGVVAIVILFWSATAAAATIRNALNRIWGVAQPRPYLLRKLVELSLVGMGGAFLILSLITSAAILRLIGVFPTLAPMVLGLEESALTRAASRAAPLVFGFLTFVVIYRYLPNVRIPWRNAIFGALVAGSLFEVAKRGFFWYLQTFARYTLVYGSLTGIIVFLVWMYLSAVILLYGAEVASQIGRPYPQEVGTA